MMPIAEEIEAPEGPPRTSGRAPDLSVIVPVHNDRRGIETLLAALAEQTLPRERFEVIVVDDRSTDDSAEVARRAGAQVVRTTRNDGSYAARNLGLANAAGEVLAFTDADCVPAPDWLERGLSALAGSGEAIAAGEIDIVLGERPSTAAIVDAARHLNQERAVKDGLCATANLFAPRRAFERIGPFNDRLISGGDGEFGSRATMAGFELRHAADAIVRHPPRSAPTALARKAYRLGFGAAQQRRHAEGPLRGRPHVCRRPGAYVPHFRFDSRERFQRGGIRLNWRRQALAQVVEYLFVQLPIVFGNLVGTLRSRADRRAPVDGAKA